MMERDKIIYAEIEDEMKKSYLDYAMSVIVGRALPDVRDGLKPVHRRILYAMNDLGLHYNKSYKKSARVVGEVLGKYHPHGDTAVYDSMVRMVQDFSLRYPLIDGQGNFGSVDGDRAAAMRYTECRLARISSELLEDIDKETVDFAPNFDESLKEPTVLPSKIPNLLVNGSSGIAVGMATNMPPHNLNEVVDGTIALIDDPTLEDTDLMEYIKGPDFPTGGTIFGKAGIIQAYSSGRGSIKIRAKTHVEGDKKRAIIVTELPYQVNKARLIEGIAELVKDKHIEGISDLRDESDRDGMRVVIEIKQSADPDIVLNQLYKHTQMQNSFGIINIALVDNKPETLSLKQIILNYIYHRKDVVTRRCQFDLEKAKKRAHILEGLRIALENIDEVVKTIKASKSPEDARNSLISKFSLSEEQSQAILDMKLQRLTGLEREKIDLEYQDLLKTIIWLEELLADEKKILTLIKKELIEVKEKYGDERRTEIIEGGDDLDIEDLIAVEDMVVTITNKGYIKRLPVETYRAQRRGGKGIIATEAKEEDFVEDVFVASTHDFVLFFTDGGQVHWLKVYKIPVSGRYSRGQAIVNLLELEQGSHITAVIKVSEFKDDQYLFAVTKKGIVKKTELSAYSRPRRGGIIGIVLKEDDELVDVLLTSGGDDVVIATEIGKSIRFNEKDARPLGRSSQGVRGIRLKSGDSVSGMVRVAQDRTLLTITENGYGKRSEFERYPLQRRGGQGVLDIKTSERNGRVVGVKSVSDHDDVMLITSTGVIIRTPVNTISKIGRNTQGVRLMKLGEGNRVVSLAKIVSDENEESSED
jgi:DNA gyrase subunit A